MKKHLELHSHYERWCRNNDNRYYYHYHVVVVAVVLCHLCLYRNNLCIPKSRDNLGEADSDAVWCQGGRERRSSSGGKEEEAERMAESHL